jgi:SAM-dependent methyltransferase
VDRSRGEAQPLKGRFRGDKELEAGSRAHYDDAAYYTKAYLRRTEDVDFYVKVARRIGGPVLEYGAGNGRIALPLARAGLSITGVDLSAEMLEDFARLRASEAPEVRRRITLRRGDMRSVRLRRRYRLILCTFNSLLHLYGRTDFERFFARVREHLAPGGRFVFDVSVPNPHELVRDPNRAYHSPRLKHPRTGEIVRYTERFDYDPVRQVLLVYMEFIPVSNPDDSWITPLAHRQLHPQELEALLHYNGFAIERVYGDFEGGTLDRSSEVMICICRASRPPARPKKRVPVAARRGPP